MLDIMYLVLTSNNYYLFVSWHHYQVGCEEFHTQKHSNQFPMRTKQWALFLMEKAITFELQGIFIISHINNLASYDELFTS